MIIDKVVRGGPTTKIPAHMSYGQYVLDKFREYSLEDRTALINGDTGIKTSFKELLQDIVNVASGLKQLGVKRGDVVAICSENRVEFFVSAVAAICCGATITTISNSYNKDELEHVLNISRPSVMIGSETTLKQYIQHFKSKPYIKKIIQFDGVPLGEGVIQYGNVHTHVNPFEYEPADVEGWNDPVFILYSSGTTGLPKGVMLTHINAIYSAANADTERAYREEVSKYLTIVPWFHAYGLMSTITFLTTRKTIVFMSGFVPQKYFKAVQDYKINVLLTVPPMVVFIAKSDLVQHYDLSSVNYVWCAAAPVSLEIINAAMARMPNCKGILQAYGMTETSTAATIDVEDQKWKLGSGGLPLPGVKAKVVDLETGKKLGPNEKGEICIKGPIVMKGYVNNEAATREMFDDEGYIKTGDIGYYDEDGFFFIVDRLKEIIKYKGHQVAPAMVERVLMQHPGVASCGVVGTPHTSAGELPTAFVELKPGVNVTQAELREFTDAKLSPSHRLHGGIIFVDDIPKNPSGKILRRVLRQKLLDSHKSKL